VWKIGPECVAQQQKKVSAMTMNCGERSAAPTEGASGASTVAPVGAIEAAIRLAARVLALPESPWTAASAAASTAVCNCTAEAETRV